ncbi:MAG: aldo/keto reductase [Eggerthellaceae bacterium]
MSNLLDTPKLGFGCMRLPLTNPEDQTAIDIEQFKDMVDAFMEAGGTYFDTAYVYHEGTSEVAVRKALVERYPRDSFTIATKCLAWAQPDADAAKACLDTSLERLGVDYIDFYLLHNVGGPRTAKFDEYGMWEWAQQKKDEGVIKHLGFSIHDGADALDKLLAEHPNMDFVQVQVNYLDWDNPVVESRKCMEVAEKHGVPVVIMEPARGGRLAELPKRGEDVLKAANPDKSTVSWAYRFCYNLPNVVSVLSGMSTLDQVKENVKEWKANAPFTEEESKVLAQAIEALESVGTIPCTNCRYCVKDCPAGVKIPEIMSLLNLEKMTENREFAKSQYAWQTRDGRASQCTQCGSCEDMCPQSINIIDLLEDAADFYED